MVKCYSYIRFSTPEQLKGDSLRRQLELSEQYARDHGLQLDTSLQDHGLSAYHGLHKIKGALGRFIQLVNEGKIPKGSTLLVESLDRLSREQVLDALTQFTDLIKAGIRIVTLQDHMLYDAESINANIGNLIISLTIMSRAHEESATKSKRLKSAWAQKRHDLNGERKLTGRCPAWLAINKLATDQKRSNIASELTIIPERAKIIRQIFQMKLAGKGVGSIVKALNQRQGIWKPLSPRTKGSKVEGWRESYINKILRNRAVIGEFQPHTFSRDETGKRIRTPDGEPLKNYYPPVIKESLFFEVQKQLRENGQRKGNAGGRVDKCGNLFTHILKCRMCKGPMHFVDKGPLPKGGQYLVCDHARRKMGCEARPIQYDEFEQIFFSNFEELNIADLLPGKDEVQNRLQDLQSLITANNHRIHELDGQEENLSQTIAETADARVRGILEKRLIKALDEKEKLQAENEVHSKEIAGLQKESQELQANIDKAREVYELLGAAKNEEVRIDLRKRLRTEIRKFIDRIAVKPLMEPYKEIQEHPEEPGIFITMNSKWIDSIAIYFNTGATKTKGRFLYLKSAVDTNQD